VNAPGLLVTLTATMAAAGEARVALRSWLTSRRCGDDDMHTAELLATELVTNAVKHTPTPVVTVSATMVGHRLRVGVLDAVPEAPPPQPVLAPAQADGGRGLWLVQRLASRWGWESHADGKEIWFESPCLGPRPVLDL
jgi:anti-sigma regulatory factor (Ser/Thr protein kinase)